MSTNRYHNKKPSVFGDNLEWNGTRLNWSSQNDKKTNRDFKNFSNESIKLRAFCKMVKMLNGFCLN